MARPPRNNIKRKEKIARISKAFIVLKALENFSGGWFFGTYVLFLLAKGQTLFQANLVNTLFMFTIFVFVPFTGFLADKFGQKRVYTLGVIVKGFSFLLYGVSQEFMHFAFAEFVSAVGRSLVSEAMESYVRNQTGKHATLKITGLAGKYAKLALIPSAILGGLIGSIYGLHWPWVISAVCQVITAVAMIMLAKKLPDEKRVRHTLSSAKVIAITFKEMMQKDYWKITLIISFIATFTFQPLNMFWSVIFKTYTGEAWWLGFIWIGVALLGSYGSHLVSGLEKLSLRNIIWILIINALPINIAAFIAIVLAGQNGIVFLTVLSGFMVHEIGRGSFIPAIFAFSNHDKDDALRSTRSSIRSSISTAGASVGLVISGYLAQVINPIGVWFVFSLVLLVLAVSLKVKGEKFKNLV